MFKTCPNCNGWYSKYQDKLLYAGKSDICKHCIEMSEVERRELGEITKRLALKRNIDYINSRRENLH